MGGSKLQLSILRRNMDDCATPAAPSFFFLGQGGALSKRSPDGCCGIGGSREAQPYPDRQLNPPSLMVSAAFKRVQVADGGSVALLFLSWEE